jgi:hypothetical protein
VTAAEATAKVVAERLVEHLEQSGFVVMRKPIPGIGTAAIQAHGVRAARPEGRRRRVSVTLDSPVERERYYCFPELQTNWQELPSEKALGCIPLHCRRRRQSLGRPHSFPVPCNRSGKQYCIAILTAIPGLLIVIGNAAIASATIKVERRNRVWGVSPIACSIDLPRSQRAARPRRELQRRDTPAG